MMSLIERRRQSAEMSKGVSMVKRDKGGTRAPMRGTSPFIAKGYPD